KKIPKAGGWRLNAQESKAMQGATRFDTVGIVWSISIKNQKVRQCQPMLTPQQSEHRFGIG
ncbi:MAG: hypothetical protein P8X90_17435, partial [Desulfobacterales bacterium]